MVCQLSSYSNKFSQLYFGCTNIVDSSFTNGTDLSPRVVVFMAGMHEKIETKEEHLKKNVNNSIYLSKCMKIQVQFASFNNDRANIIY